MSARKQHFYFPLTLTHSDCFGLVNTDSHIFWLILKNSRFICFLFSFLPPSLQKISLRAGGFLCFKLVYYLLGFRGSLMICVRRAFVFLLTGKTDFSRQHLRELFTLLQLYFLFTGIFSNLSTAKANSFMAEIFRIISNLNVFKGGSFRCFCFVHQFHFRVCNLQKFSRITKSFTRTLDCFLGFSW